MAAHGRQKLGDIGPAACGASTVDPVGVPMATTMGGERPGLRARPLCALPSKWG
jgi:hypothetical protein